MVAIILAEHYYVHTNTGGGHGYCNRMTMKFWHKPTIFVYEIFVLIEHCNIMQPLLVGPTLMYFCGITARQRLRKNA